MLPRHAAPFQLGDVVDEFVALPTNFAGFVHEGTDFLFVLGVLDFEGGQRFRDLSLQGVLRVLR